MMNPEFNRSAVNAADCIGTGWNLVTRNLGLYIGVTVVAALMIIVVSCIPFVNIFLIAPIMGGVYYIALRDINNEPIDFGMMFKGFEKFVPLMVIGVIQGIPSVIFQAFRLTVNFANVLSRGGAMPSRRSDFFQATQPDLSGILAGLSALMIVVSLVFIVFSIIWGLLFFFAVPQVIDRNLGPIDAIKMSFSAAMGNFGGVLALLILCGFVVLLGVIALCFGLLVAIPVTWVASAYAYRLVFPRLNQNYYSTPPPPSAYGSTFGQGM